MSVSDHFVEIGTGGLGFIRDDLVLALPYVP